MNKVLDINQVSKLINKVKQQKKTIVLVGGGFDVLHHGHIKFLEEANKAGDVLIVLLESDQNLKRKKGQNRPINDQKNRSIVLGALKSVGYIIHLQGVTKDEEYDKLIVQIKPDVIALTREDPNITKREEQSKMVEANLVIIEKVDSPSTSDLTRRI